MLEIKRICIRCKLNPIVKHPRFPNAKICNECFIKSLDKLFLELELSGKLWETDGGKFQ